MSKDRERKPRKLGKSRTSENRISVRQREAFGENFKDLREWVAAGKSATEINEILKERGVKPYTQPAISIIAGKLGTPLGSFTRPNYSPRGVESSESNASSHDTHAAGRRIRRSEAFGDKYEKLQERLNHGETLYQIASWASSNEFSITPGRIYEIIEKNKLEFPRRASYTPIIEDLKMKPYFEIFAFLAGVAEDSLRQDVLNRIMGADYKTLQQIAERKFSLSGRRITGERVRQIQESILDNLYRIQEIVHSEEEQK